MLLCTWEYVVKLINLVFKNVPNICWLESTVRDAVMNQKLPSSFKKLPPRKGVIAGRAVLDTTE